MIKINKYRVSFTTIHSEDEINDFYFQVNVLPNMPPEEVDELIENVAATILSENRERYGLSEDFLDNEELEEVDIKLLDIDFDFSDENDFEEV